MTITPASAAKSGGPRGKAATLADPQLLAERLAGLASPSVFELERLRASIEERHGPTPHFDPFDGGSGARVLLLLETPGPGSSTGRFVSRDNPTVTAANIRRFSAAADLDRRDTIIWNTVPWVVHLPGAKNRALRRAEITDGLGELPGIIGCLTKLDTVVLTGRVAATAEPLIRDLCPNLRILRMPHPSPTYVNTASWISDVIVSVLKQAAHTGSPVSDP